MINPLLELLGWDLGFDARIDSEIDVGSNSYTMDYALMGDSDPDVLLCVKPLEETLTSSNSDFMESCLESSVATLGMITNGKNFELYQAEDDVRKLGIEKIDRDSNNILNLLSKSNVRSVLYVSARKFIQ